MSVSEKAAQNAGLAAKGDSVLRMFFALAHDLHRTSVCNRISPTHVSTLLESESLDYSDYRNPIVGL